MKYLVELRGNGAIVQFPHSKRHNFSLVHVLCATLVYQFTSVACFQRNLRLAKLHRGSPAEGMMGVEAVTEANAVSRAMAEYRKLGKKAFLSKYGFGASRGWLLVDFEGRVYDAKAVLGAAHGFQHPKAGPLPAHEFHGGESTARRLRELGFKVTEPGARNPTWSRDELILALDLYLRCRPKFPGPHHPEVLELSNFLVRLATATGVAGNATFRNPNGVALKIQNLSRFDGPFVPKGMPGGGKGEKEVWDTFAGDPDRLRATVEAIRRYVESPEVTPLDDIGPELEAEEGRLLTRVHTYRERDKDIVRKKKAKAMKRHGTLRCEVCEFDYSKCYGALGEGFIECHHTRPVSQLRPGEKTLEQDLALLCSNCHRMVHVSRPWLTLDELKQRMRSQNGQGA